MPGERLSRGRPSGYVSSPIHFDLFPAAFFVHFSIPLRFTYAAPTLHKIRQLSGSVLLVFALVYYIGPMPFYIPLLLPPTSVVPVSSFTMTILFLPSTTPFHSLGMHISPSSTHCYNSESELARTSSFSSCPSICSLCLRYPDYFLNSSFFSLLSHFRLNKLMLINSTINSSSPAS